MRVPKCKTLQRHVWVRSGGCAENPGVFGSGGSVKVVSECRCGMVRIQDYWDARRNRPSPGGIVSYRTEDGELVDCR